MPASERKWDANAQRDLCLAVILTSHNGRSHNWAQIHSLMDKMGYSFTKDAICQHFTKVIFKDFRMRHQDLVPEMATPKKRRGSSATKSRSGRHGDGPASPATPTSPSPSARKKGKAAAQVGDWNASDVEDSPTLGWQ